MGSHMAYDLEKYREKREKVLGIKKRGLSFGAWTTIVSVVILLGLGAVIIPESIDYLTTRHLEDAIFKLDSNTRWPEIVVSELVAIKGVKFAAMDKGATRLVVTFDRHVTGVPHIAAYFREKGYNTVMLNQVSHRQRQSTLKEEAKLEAL